jgi:hypothetical protein
LKVARDFKGSKFEEKLKEGKSKPFYPFIQQKIDEYFSTLQH